MKAVRFKSSLRVRRMAIGGNQLLRNELLDEYAYLLSNNIFIKSVKSGKIGNYLTF